MNPGVMPNPAGIVPLGAAYRLILVTRLVLRVGDIVPIPAGSFYDIILFGSGGSGGAGGSGTDYGAMFAMATLSILPAVLIFFCLQRYLVEGISTSGLKG